MSPLNGVEIKEASVERGHSHGRRPSLCPWKLFIEKQDLLGRVLCASSISTVPSPPFCKALGPCERPDLRGTALSNKLGNTIHCT